jgi:hypothetical protein
MPGTPSGQPGLVNLRQFCELMEEVLATRRYSPGRSDCLCPFIAWLEALA